MSLELAAGGGRYSFRIVARLEDCGLELWNAATHESPLFLRAPYLTALEMGMPDSLEARYGVLSMGARPVAVMVGQILTLSADRVSDAATAKERNKLAQAVLSKVRARVFLWGNFLGWGYSGIAFAPGVDQAAVWPALAEAIDRSGEADEGVHDAGLQLVLDIGAAQAAGAEGLTAHRFTPMQAEPDMILSIDPAWKTFDDYRTALKAKYRKASLEMDAALTAAGCTIETLNDIEAHADALIDLHLQVHENNAHRFVTLKRAFIPALAHQLGSGFICTVIRRGAELLGFITVLIDGDTALAYVVGHNMEANRSLPVYLRLLQTAVETGIARGCKRVTYGRTALEPKARVGAVPVPLTIYGRHRNRLIGPLVTPLLQSMAPTAGPPQRSPFKSAAE